MVFMIGLWLVNTIDSVYSCVLMYMLCFIRLVSAWFSVCFQGCSVVGSVGSWWVNTDWWLLVMVSSQQWAIKLKIRMIASTISRKLPTTTWGYHHLWANQLWIHRISAVSKPYCTGRPRNTDWRIWNLTLFIWICWHPPTIPRDDYYEIHQCWFVMICLQKKIVELGKLWCFACQASSFSDAAGEWRVWTSIHS